MGFSGCVVSYFVALFRALSRSCTLCRTIGLVEADANRHSRHPPNLGFRPHSSGWVAQPAPEPPRKRVGASLRAVSGFGYTKIPPRLATRCNPLKSRFQILTHRADRRRLFSHGRKGGIVRLSISPPAGRSLYVRVRVTCA